MVRLIKLHSSEFPNTLVDEKSPNSIRFRIEYADDEDGITSEDVDAIRLLTQISLRQPYFNIETQNFTNTPRQHFMLGHMLKFLPVCGINHEDARTKKTHIKVDVFNQFKDVVAVTTKDIHFFVDDIKIKDPYSKNEHLITRLRKGERVSFMASLEWGDADIIEAHQQVILVPKINHDFENKKFDMLMESRGFWTCDEILEQAFNLLLTKLKRYKSILRCKFDDALNYSVYEKEHGFKIISISTIPNIYLNCTLNVNIPNQVDFDLAIKNILHHIINSEPDCVFMFEHFSPKIILSIKSKEIFSRLNKIEGDKRRN